MKLIIITILPGQSPSLLNIKPPNKMMNASANSIPQININSPNPVIEASLNKFNNQSANYQNNLQSNYQSQSQENYMNLGPGNMPGAFEDNNWHRLKVGESRSMSESIDQISQMDSMIKENIGHFRY